MVLTQRIGKTCTPPKRPHNCQDLLRVVQSWCWRSTARSLKTFLFPHRSIKSELDLPSCSRTWISPTAWAWIDLYSLYLLPCNSKSCVWLSELISTYFLYQLPPVQIVESGKLSQLPSEKRKRYTSDSSIESHMERNGLSQTHAN